MNSITFRKILFKHNLVLSQDADFLHDNSLICIVTAKCNFKKTGANVRARFQLKKTIFSSFHVLSLNELECIASTELNNSRNVNIFKTGLEKITF